MNGILFTFRSVTTAQRGEAAVRVRGIEAAVRRTPRHLEDRGCGYCLLVSERNGQQTAAVLRENGVPFRRVYRARGEYTEEIRL